MANDFLAELKEINEWILHVQKQMDAFGHKIKEEFNIPQLKDELLTLPEQIKKAQIVALQKKAELTEFEQQQMGQRTAEVFFEITNEKGDNGKAKLTNEPTRKAELTIRLGKDEQYLALKKERSAIESEVWGSEAEVECLRRELQVRLAIKDLVCAELNLYTK